MRMRRDTEAEVGEMCFEDGRRGCKKRKAGSLQKLEMVRNTFCPRDSRRKVDLPTP